MTIVDGFCQAEWGMSGWALTKAPATKKLQELFCFYVVL